VPAKILLIDDDHDTLKLIGLILERRGYRVSTADHGQLALEQAASEPADLILLDIMMPGIDGLEVTRRLRRQPGTARTPIILFSARSREADRLAGFEAGADDYLTKPIQPNELVLRIEALLKRGLQ
jgi:DNA-binding response OmpR family regulator